MNQLITAILAHLGEKGADKKRNATLLVLLVVAWQVFSIEKRLAHVESRLGIVAQAVVPPNTNTLATVGPEWPARAAAAFQ